MSDHDELGFLGRGRDQRGQGGQQIRVQRCLRFVEYQQLGRARAEEGGDPEEVTQCAVRQFGRTQWPEQAVLEEAQLETALAGVSDFEP